jgi:glycosyltransferase involved in cell wall biosynthesis
MRNCKNMPPRLAIVLSHPIQHFCPLYASWANCPDWEVRVFFGSKAGLHPYVDRSFGKTVHWDGLETEEFPHEFVNGEDASPVTSSTDSPALNDALRAFSPHALLTYGYSQRLQRRAQAWAVESGVPVVYFSDSELRRHQIWWKRAGKALVLPAKFRQFSCFLVTGNANEQYYLKYGVPAWKMLRASYPIDQRSFLAAYERRSELREGARRSLGLGCSDHVALMVGKLVRWKRQDDLIATTGIGGCLPTSVVLVGSGPKEAEWRSLAPVGQSRSRVIFAGFKQPSELPALYAAADVYVHASEIEPHSVAISEAAFMGLPILVSDRCGSYGTDDDVRPGENGFVYPCGDVHALARAIDRLASRPDLRLAMGRRSHEIAKQQQRMAHDQVLPSLRRFLDV